MFPPFFESGTKYLDARPKFLNLLDSNLNLPPILKIGCVQITTLLLIQKVSL
jgi:hypothetical protein